MVHASRIPAGRTWQRGYIDALQVRIFQ